ncbi:MAG: response regulator [Bacteroidales bacterium]|nr:response regulator [Bacteroidales bacterium]
MSLLPKILYIDDEPENLIGFKVSFAREFLIFTAENTQEAYQIMKSQDIVVAIVDFKMPGEDGISFIERVKDEFSEVVFMVISGYADIEAVIKAINMNCLRNFVQKPWNYNEMRIVLKNAVESGQIKKENKKLLELLLENNRQLQESMERERNLSELKSVF